MLGRPPDEGLTIATLAADVSVVLREQQVWWHGLSHREREIMKLRHGLGDGYVYTLEEVGHIFKVTRERIRQIEAKALRKLAARGITKEDLPRFIGQPSSETSPGGASGGA